MGLHLGFKKTVLLVLLMPVFAGNAQNGDDPVRLEFPSGTNYDIFKIVPYGSKGLMLFHASDQVNQEGIRKWVFSRINNRLEILWTRDFPIHDQLHFLSYTNEKDDYYLLFQHQGKIKQDEPNIQILHCNPDDTTMFSMNGSLPEKSEVVSFKVNQGKAIIGLNDKDMQARLYFVDLNTGQVKDIQMVSGGNSFVEDIFMTADGNTIYALVNHFTGRRDNFMVLNIYSPDGNTQGSFIIENPEKDNKLNLGRVTSDTNGVLYVAGTFNNPSGPDYNVNKRNDISAAGFYLCRLDSTRQSFIRFYNFLEFPNFFSAMNGSEWMRAKRYNQKKPNDHYSMNYKLLLHDLIVKDSQLLFISEAYYPEYITVTDMVYDYYGRPYPQTYTVFDGYKYFAAFFAAFNPEGKILWENGLDIWNIKSNTLTYHISAQFDEEDLITVYNSEGKLASKLFRNGESIGEMEYDELQTLYNRDRVMEDENSRIIPWYNNFYLAFGYQSIRNNILPSSNKRSVFYINKIIYQ